MKKERHQSKNMTQYEMRIQNTRIQSDDYDGAFCAVCAGAIIILRKQGWGRGSKPGALRFVKEILCYVKHQKIVCT